MILRVEELHGIEAPVVLRAADERECALGGLTGEQALVRSIEGSQESWMATLGGLPLFYWGYLPQAMLSNVAYAWFLSTPLADEHPVAVGRLTRTEFAKMQEHHPTLFCDVDPEHTVALRWLRWLGFRGVQMNGPFLRMRADKGDNTWVS